MPDNQAPPPDHAQPAQESFDCRLELLPRRAQLRLSGRFDFMARRQIAGPMEQALAAPRVEDVTLDLRLVDYLDSAALGQLLVLQEKAAAAGKRLVLSGATGRALAILQVANFAKRIPMTP